MISRFMVLNLRKNDFYLHYFSEVYGSISLMKRLQSHQLMFIVVKNGLECLLKCMATQGCVSVNVYNDQLSCLENLCCEMNDDVATQHKQDFWDDITSQYYELDHCA